VDHFPEGLVEGEGPLVGGKGIEGSVVHAGQQLCCCRCTLMVADGDPPLLFGPGIEGTPETAGRKLQFFVVVGDGGAEGFGEQPVMANHHQGDDDIAAVAFPDGNRYEELAPVKIQLLFHDQSSFGNGFKEDHGIFQGGGHQQGEVFPGLCFGAKKPGRHGIREGRIPRLRPEQPEDLGGGDLFALCIAGGEGQLVGSRSEGGGEGKAAVAGALKAPLPHSPAPRPVGGIRFIAVPFPGEPFGVFAAGHGKPVGLLPSPLKKRGSGGLQLRQGIVGGGGEGFSARAGNGDPHLTARGSVDHFPEAGGDQKRLKGSTHGSLPAAGLPVDVGHIGISRIGEDRL